MISNSVFIAFGVNIVLAIAAGVFFIVRYRKTTGFFPSLIWGIGISFLTNVIINLVGGTLFPKGFADINIVLIALINAALMTVGIAGAYIVASNFQFKKGINPKVALINAFGYVLISLVNVAMQSTYFIMNASAINAGTAGEFISQTFTAETLEKLTHELVNNSPLLYLDSFLTVLLNFVILTIVFSLIVNSIKKNSKLDPKTGILAVVSLFVYYFISIYLVRLGTDYLVLNYVVRIVLVAGAVKLFAKELDL